jgi:hypothetical protein
MPDTGRATVTITDPYRRASVVACHQRLSDREARDLAAIYSVPGYATHLVVITHADEEEAA